MCHVPGRRRQVVAQRVMQQVRRQALRAACERNGFFYLVNHGVPLTLMREVVAQGRRLLLTSGKHELGGGELYRISQRIAEARALGDLKENGDYHAAREQHESALIVRRVVEGAGRGPDHQQRAWPERGVQRARDEPNPLHRDLDHGAGLRSGPQPDPGLGPAQPGPHCRAGGRGLGHDRSRSCGGHPCSIGLQHHGAAGGPD